VRQAQLPLFCEREDELLVVLRVVDTDRLAGSERDDAGLHRRGLRSPTEEGDVRLITGAERHHPYASARSRRRGAARPRTRIADMLGTRIGRCVHAAREGERGGVRTASVL